MDEQQRRLRRAAAEEFMRSLEQLGEMLDDEESSDEIAQELPAQPQAEADLNGPLRLDLDFGHSYGRRPSSSSLETPSPEPPVAGNGAAETQWSQRQDSRKS